MAAMTVTIKRGLSDKDFRGWVAIMKRANGKFNPQTKEWTLADGVLHQDKLSLEWGIRDGDIIVDEGGDWEECGSRIENGNDGFYEITQLRRPKTGGGFEYKETRRYVG